MYNGQCACLFQYKRAIVFDLRRVATYPFNIVEIAENVLSRHMLTIKLNNSSHSDGYIP